MDLDFHGMKRKRLQALCKKHGIPANLKNKEMADRLSFIFKGKELEDPIGSGNVGTKKGTPRCVGGKDINAEMVDLVTPSPGLEERSVVSAKNLKGLEIERLEFEMNSSPEIKTGHSGILVVEEDMKSGLNEEQVVNNQGNLHSEPVVVAFEEFNSPLVEGEVEKLGDKNNLLEGICENGKGRDEAVEQGDHNSPQGSNMMDVNVLYVSQEESLYPMVEEDEAAEQGSLSSPQASKMKDVNVLHVSQEESGYPMMEEYEAAKQDDHSSPQGSNMKDMNVLHVSHEESVYPMVEDDEAVEQGNQNSPQASNMKDVNVLLVSQEESGYSVVEEDEAAGQGDQNSPQGSNMKDMNVLHVTNEEFVYPMVEGDEAAELGNHNSPQESNMKDVNVLHVFPEESGYHMVEEEDVEQGDHSSPQASNIKVLNVLHVSPKESGYHMVEEEAVEQGNHSSPQASNLKVVNVLHVSQEESGYPMVEEVQKSQGNHSSPQGSGMKDENVLHVTHEEYGYPMVEEDEAAEQGNQNGPQGSNMKDVNVLHVSPEKSGYPMAEEDEDAEQGDHSSPQGSNMKNMNVLHVSHEEFVYPMVEDDEAVEQGSLNSPQTSNMKDVNVLHVSQEESGYSVVEEDEAAEQGDHNSPQGSNIKDMNVLCVTHEEFVYPMVEGDEAAELGNHNSPQASNMKDMNVLHASPEESGCHTVEEAVGQGDHSSSQASNMKEVNVFHVSQEVSGYPMVEEDEAAEQGNQNSTQALNMKDVNVLHVSPEESGYPMVEEVQKSDDNIYNGSVYNFQNSGSEVAAKDTDGKTNLTAEHFVDDVPSSLNKYLVGTSYLFQRTYPENEVKSSGLNIHQDTCEEELKTPQKTGPIADPGECIGFSPNNLEASAVKGFQAETYFLSSALEDVEGTCNMKERTESVKMEQVDDSQQIIHSASSVMVLNNEDLVQVASVEVGDNLLEEEVVKSGLLADSEECIGYMPNNLEPSATKGFQAETYFDSSTLGDVATCNIEESIESDQMEKKYSQEVLNMANELQRSMEESDPMEGEVTRLFDNSDDHDAAGGIEAEDKSQQVIHSASSVMVLNNEDLVQVASVEVGDNLLEEEVVKSGLLADSEECIGYMPNNLEPSATKGFQAETYFDSSTLGHVETCNIEESIESDQMEKKYSQEVLNMANELQRSMEESDPMEGEVTRLFDKSDDHDDAGGTEPEDKSQCYIKSDIDRIEKYLLNDFQSIDDADEQNSDEKPDEYAPTVPQSVEMNSSTFNLQQISAPDTISGDEGTFREKLETPTKCTPIPSSEDSVIFYPNVESSMKLIVKSLPVKRARDVLGASDMKENIKIAKKEQVGTIISRSAFPKRKPLQDLQQN